MVGDLFQIWAQMEMFPIEKRKSRIFFMEFYPVHIKYSKNIRK